MDELAHFVRASGYRCDSISALRPLPTSNGFKLACNHSTYKYEIEDKGSGSIVTVEWALGPERRFPPPWRGNRRVSCQALYAYLEDEPHIEDEPHFPRQAKKPAIGG